MSVTLKQWNGENISPLDDAVLYQHFDNRSGIIFGCAVTHLGGNQLQVASGRGMICGREFEVQQETVLATLGAGVPGRLLLVVDTSNVSAPISFVTQAASPLPALVQDDINQGGTVYQLPLATYTAGNAAISDLIVIDNTLVALPDLIGEKAGKSGYTANRVLVSNGSGNLVVGSVSTTKLGYINGLTSDAQAQINGKQDVWSGGLPVNKGGTGQTSVDNAPTSGSARMVKSGGVYDAIHDATTRQAPTQQISVSTTLTTADAGKWFSCMNTSGITITVPASAATGMEFLFLRFGGGSVTFAGNENVNIVSAGGLSILDQYGVACLKKTGSATWTLFGDV